MPATASRSDVRIGPGRLEPWQAALIILHGGLPVGGAKQWTRSRFARDGARLVRSIWNTQATILRTVVPKFARTARSVMDNQIEAIVRRVTGRKSLGGTSVDEMTMIWLTAADTVIEEMRHETDLRLEPEIESVHRAGWDATTSLLSGEPKEWPGMTTKDIARLARLITGIDRTTKQQVRNVILRLVREEGATTGGVADGIMEVMGGISRSRAMTIARTEMGTALTAENAHVFANSGLVTHVSVIGCQEREPNSPHYRGESTCNIQDVPIAELDALMEVGWHPNHTGTLVPSGFAE